VLETKFIVLNFMSRNPHERHPGCVYSSTVSSACSDSAPFKFKKGNTQELLLSKYQNSNSFKFGSNWHGIFREEDF
jgi:hypothetical protein